MGPSTFWDRTIRGVATFWLAAFWIGGVAVPISILLSRVSNWNSLWEPGVLHVTRMTVGQAILSAGIAALIGLPLGLWVGSAHARQRQWAQALLALPFGVPTIVAGLAWVVLLGRSGIFSGLDWAYSFKGVILAHIVFNVPWVALWVAQSRAHVPANLLEVAHTLGAEKRSMLLTVIWPQVKWAFFGSACQAFVFCVMSFALILVLGGGPPVETLEVALYTSMRFGDLNLSRAIACAVWELFITLLPWSLVIYFQARDDRFSVRSSSDLRGDTTRIGLLGWVTVGVCALFFLPYLSVLTTGKPWDANEYSPLWQEAIPAFRVSLILAVATAMGAVLTAVAAVVAIERLPRDKQGARSALAFLVGLPSGISALVLGLGIWLAYGRWIDPFSGSYLAIIALQIAIFFPIAFRVFWPVVRERPVRLVEAASLLGASRSRAFWLVEWPRWKAPVLSALGMIAGASLGEVAAVSLFYSENLIPLPLLISRWSSQYRFQDAQTVSILLLFLCSGMILLAYPFTISSTRAGQKA